MADINLSVNESMAIADVKIVSKLLTIDVNESIAVTEALGFGSVYLNESLLLIENVAIEFEFDFANFLRGLPFVEITNTSIDRVDLGGGYVQYIDNWSRTKKEFEITIPISHNSEIAEYQSVFDLNYNKVFNFTNPNNGIMYHVRFKLNSFRIEKIYYDTYIGKIVLEQVL